MWQRVRDYWMPRLLFLGTLGTAGGLGLGVLLAPWLAGAGPVVGLFAADATVRRTALACAVGLTVTAFVFFRPSRLPAVKKRAARPGPPGDIAGA